MVMFGDGDILMVMLGDCDVLMVIDISGDGDVWLC